uniref:S1 motif domain-containing protein n=1 Tax=Anopheles minimus TaxID=112268 RepID=A0A182VQ68_9DIPT
MVNVEPAFPRGKKVQRNILTKHVKKPEFSVKKYGATVLPEEKAVRLRPKERHQVMLSEKETDVTWTQQALDASNLSFRSIQEGMLVLGCVKRIGKAIIELFLPGRINAQVPISMISNAYSNRLKKMIDTGSTDCPTLNDLYRCGDLVYVTLLHKPVKPNVKLTFSLKPSDLHRSFAPSQLVPGLVMSATIVEKEDHGYSMDIGVRNVRAFLPEEKLGQNRDDVGRNLLCSIETVSKLAYKVTVILKAFDPDTPRVLNVEEEVDLNTIVPGCRVMFSVGEPVEHGLRGMLFDDMVPAYVNKNMLTKVTSTPEKYSMFKKIPATLLYVMPRTNQVFVSLTPYPNNRIEMNVSNGPGTIIEKAYVKSVDYVGVWFLFQNKYRALLPRNFLLSRIASSDNVDESVLMSNFQIGTTCKLAVVSYNPLENTYIVTNDPSTINEEILSPDDIIVGNTYKCRVCKVIDDGAYVIVGNVRGSLLYVYYDRNQPVQVNDTVLLRAVMREYDSPFVKFTNHPALVDESASILYDWDQLDATQNQSFHGIIFKQNCNNALVRFCNNIVGFMPKIRNNPQMANLRINTVYKFTVLEFDKATNKLVLTLASTDEAIPSAVSVEATITCVHAAGVDVQTEDSKTGTIPSECLSEFGEHNSLYMRLLKEGRTVAVVQTNTDTYSMRLIPYFKEHPKHIESVESGALLKGSCSTVNGVLYVTPLLSNFSQQIEVKRKENYCEVKDGSIMMMRVLDVKKSSKEGYNLHVSTALLDVCENGKQDVFNFMVEYLKDVKNLIQRYQEANYAFANYTLGELVECVVESIVPESNKLAVEVRAIDKETKNAAKGIATAILPNQPASSYKVGKKVPGRVVWIDVERKLVHVCLDPPLVERILPEGSPMGTKYPANPVQCWVLFANNYVQVCCLQTVPLNALVIVPLKHHYNDMVDRGNNTTNTVKVRLLWNYEKMVFAMQEQMVLFYEMCFATAHAKQGRIHRQQASKTIDEPSINEEDESENDAYDVSPMEGMTRVADNEAEDADATYDRMDEESDDGLSIPTPTTRSISNGKKQKKKATSKSSKKGDDKTKLKRKIVALKKNGFMEI